MRLAGNLLQWIEECGSDQPLGSIVRHSLIALSNADIRWHINKPSTSFRQESNYYPHPTTRQYLPKWNLHRVICLQLEGRRRGRDPLDD